MSFMKAMYNFECELNDSNRNLYTSFRLKTSQHDEEPTLHLTARLTAFCHAYQPNLSFENIDKNYISPELVQRSLASDFEVCCFVGCPDIKSLRHTLRSAVRSANISVYFYDREQIERFLHYLRGSKNNWIQEIHFYLVDSLALAQLSESIEPRVKWSVTVSDDILFIESGTQQVALEIHQLEMWQEFQRSILNV